jgi:elongation factor Ts
MSTPTISPKDVMTLRERTGLGMMDCKAALAEANGDMKLAEERLREKLKGKMDTRTDRAAGEGCIAVGMDGDRAAIVEVRAETDFTARNPEFRTMAEDLARMSCKGKPGQAENTEGMKKRLDDVRIKTGENISFAGGVVLEGGKFGCYVHHDGKKGALLQFTGDLPADVATGICQHIVAATPTPIAVDEKGVPAELVAARQREAIEEAKASGKPEQIAAKMAEGKMRKFFEEVTLLGQIYVRDDKKRIRELLPQGCTLVTFVRMTLGHHS